jgi:hypothetical protein
MIYNTPWMHEIIDDFLSKEDFDFLSSINIDSTSVDSNAISKNKIFADGSIVSNLPEEWLLNFKEKYFYKTVEILKQHAPDKVDKVHYMELNVVESGPHFQFPIHPDSLDKLLSCVIYLQPVNNNGTILYSSNEGADAHMAEWKQNRCVIFSRTDKTWHSYGGDSINSRRTLVLNLRSEKKK